MMSCYMDLRYAIPPLINLLSKLLHFQFEPNLGQNDHLLDPNHHLIIKLALVFLIAIVVLLFLLTSAKLQLNVRVTANTIRLRTGDFSAPVALSLLCSILLPPPHFWIAYAMIICISPWQYGSLVNLLMQILLWIRQTLQSIPDLNIFCIIQQEAEPPQVEVEMVEIGRYPLQQEQQGLGQDFIVVNIDRQD